MRRLEHVARVHRAFGLAGAHHGVQLVDEDDGLAFVFGQLVEHGFQALFKLAAELGAGQQRSHVERQHALALERIRHLAGHDALGQAFNDGGLADTGLADQHGVVFGAALQHLDGAADLVVAADDRVELAQAGALGQVHAVFFEGFALAFGVGAVHALPAAHRVNRGFERFAGQAVFAGKAPHIGLAVSHGQQEKLTGDELVAALDGFFFSGLQELHQLGADLDLVLAFDLGQLLDGGFGRL
jgi:hypothetical protein